jgi:hypothetical protein
MLIVRRNQMLNDDPAGCAKDVETFCFWAERSVY